MKKYLIKNGIMILFAGSLVFFAGCCEKKGADHGDDHGKAGHGAHWTYKGESGPAHWGDLKEEYAACKTGKAQSPIDITGSFGTQERTLAFNYKETGSKIVDNGHTVQINPGEGGSIEINGEKFDLLQFHFHSPSEHTVDGKSFPLEMHLVHKNAAGQLAVVGILFNEGEENSTIATLWKSMPHEENHEMEVAGGMIDPTTLLPEDKTFFSYDGSLTTPPCSEGVKWQVMVSPMTVSAEQVEAFKSRHPDSNRPVQELNGRTIGK